MNDNIIWHHATVTRSRREKLNNHKSILLWFTGLSGSGKSTLAHAIEEELHKLKCRTFVLDGDNIRHNLCSDLGFERTDRNENIRRIGEVSKLFVEAGVIVLAAFISPFSGERQQVRALFSEDEFLEVYCECPITTCEKRDIKGHYKRAHAGEIKNFTGIDSPYEEPENPALKINTDHMSLEDSVELVMDLLRQKDIINNSNA
ncbi:Adenylylsulfate kinase [hydrothermal vent metagenome]|uniref:adenylyl-sulfate kinase n=1 Tax=hydrothermal vent metagenome TaxID=652676 RepID=A0A3B0YLE3_9ZZZZ